MDECIFCAIARGDVPSHKIYEDDETLAFLGIHPPVEGFVLVIPKTHSKEVWQMTEFDYQKLMDTVYKVGNRLKEVYKPQRVGVQIEGLEVAHTHVKVFPFTTENEFRAKEPDNESDHLKLAEVAKSIEFQ